MLIQNTTKTNENQIDHKQDLIFELTTKSKPEDIKFNQCLSYSSDKLGLDRSLLCKYRYQEYFEAYNTNLCN
jgi:hypothetical protein